jgi:phosphoesterase RecJ-like protein
MQDAEGIGDDAAAEAASEVTDYLSSFGGFHASALFKERRDGTVKVSLRARPPIDVASVAQQFGGGGHRQAAGCTIAGSLANAEERVLAALRVAVASAD